jgi:hypothetical protein
VMLAAKHLSHPLSRSACQTGWGRLPKRSCVKSWKIAVKRASERGYDRSHKAEIAVRVKARMLIA